MSDPSILQESHCPLCGGTAVALPVPHPNQSIASDGQTVSRALRKQSCLHCGAASHASRVPDDKVRATYDAGYQLAGAAPKSDAARARAFADWFRNEDMAPRSVLEVGCGSGALLRELSSIWPEATLTGIDPALPGPGRSDGRLRLERGFVEDIPNDVRDFDLILAVNVIEHMPDPARFLASLQARLGPGSKIWIVCPAAEPPNVELLFHDHLYSLTPDALDFAVRSTPLVARSTAPAPPAVGDFKMTVFDAVGRTAVQPARQHSFSDLWSERKSYLECWKTLDGVLLTRLKPASRLVMFGGGQTAALLRAYAPCIWARTEAIILDEVSESWTLDKPIEAYGRAVKELAGVEVLIATAPRVQKIIFERLREDGVRSIRWDDVITA
jgi:SAM-dependent methyltransferase